LEKGEAAEKPAHKTYPEKQNQSESISETRRPSLSKSGGQHERRQKAAEEKAQETLKDGKSLHDIADASTVRA
jgi:flagellar hook-basal body complex protein FliE